MLTLDIVMRYLVKWIRRRRWVAIALLLFLALTTSCVYEARTSFLSARLLSAIAADLSYAVRSGASPAIVFPEVGPFNSARGYTALPDFQHRLVDAGYHIVAQSVFSPELERFVRWGIRPPYREPAAGGLVIRGTHRNVLYSAAARHRLFAGFEEIPTLLVQALLFVENRQLDDPGSPTRNPVVDWGRSGKAAVSFAGRKIGLPFQLEGGSTLATQIEKFRYAQDGRTRSVSDKLQQMLSASIRVYRSGPDTRAERRAIMLDYLNSVPLAAAPHYGEVNGFGDGLWAWFGIDIRKFVADLAESSPERVRLNAFKHALTLICAARAPSFYLLKDRSALEERVDFYAHELAGAGVISKDFAKMAQLIPVKFSTLRPSSLPVHYAERKAASAIRNHLRSILDVSNLYALDRLHLEVKSTLNADLQKSVIGLFERLKDPAFLDANGFRHRQLLPRGDPSKVRYSFTLFERTSAGNMLRAQVDTLRQPFDLNEGMKAELGSTAKLRTLAHYLELIASLYEEFRGLDSVEVAVRALSASDDPITRWVAETLSSAADLDLPLLLEKALDRKYSGSPAEVFFTGGGAHRFSNFDRREDGLMYTVRDGLKESVNLVYIRLMRDLVKFHQSRLDYVRKAVLNQPEHPQRLRLLQEIAENESEYFLRRAYRQYRTLTPEAAIGRLLQGRADSLRHLSMLFLAWNDGADATALRDWLKAKGHPISEDEARKLFRSYDPARLNLSDYGYLLRRHPLEIWCAGQLVRNPGTSWNDLFRASSAAREISSRWLFQTRNKEAQNRRLRVRFEQDAFVHMTPYWRALGFPFERLVPSLATAIGSSADRPIALAELMGIILNDGIQLPVLRFEELRFANGTPYQTDFRPDRLAGKRVMQEPVARALRQVLAEVVEDGTAKRLAGVFNDSHGTPLISGGKTGSGDNRRQTFRGGTLLQSRAVSRTGTFAFYIGDRFFGVLTAYVDEDAENYSFTSALPVSALKFLAPAIEPAMRLTARGEEPVSTLLFD